MSALKCRGKGDSSKAALCWFVLAAVVVFLSCPMAAGEPISIQDIEAKGLSVRGFLEEMVGTDKRKLDLILKNWEEEDSREVESGRSTDAPISTATLKEDLNLKPAVLVFRQCQGSGRLERWGFKMDDLPEYTKGDIPYMRFYLKAASTDTKGVIVEIVFNRPNPEVYITEVIERGEAEGKSLRQLINALNKKDAPEVQGPEGPMVGSLIKPGPAMCGSYEFSDAFSKTVPGYSPVLILLPSCDGSLMCQARGPGRLVFNGGEEGTVTLEYMGLWLNA